MGVMSGPRVVPKGYAWMLENNHKIDRILAELVERAQKLRFIVYCVVPVPGTGRKQFFVERWEAAFIDATHIEVRWVRTSRDDCDGRIASYAGTLKVDWPSLATRLRRTPTAREAFSSVVLLGSPADQRKWLYSHAWQWDCLINVDGQIVDRFGAPRAAKRAASSALRRKGKPR